MSKFNSLFLIPFIIPYSFHCVLVLILPYTSKMYTLTNCKSYTFCTCYYKTNYHQLSNSLQNSTTSTANRTEKKQCALFGSLFHTHTHTHFLSFTYFFALSCSLSRLYMHTSPLRTLGARYYCVS